MRASTAFFAGAGTVVVAVAAGLGGGYLAANIVSPPTQVISKLERRMSAEPIPVSKEPSEPVPHVAATVAAANAAPAEEQPQTQPQQAQPQPQTQPQSQTAAAAPSANDASTEEKTATNNAAAARPAPPPPKPSKPAEQASEKTAAPQEAFAKARDADLKRAAAEQRRAERRQRWADKRRFQQPREQDLEAVETQVRDATERRRIIVREEAEPRELFAGEPARIEMPRIRLFDQD